MQRIPESIGERRVLVDTSAFLALADIRDRYHQHAQQVLQRIVVGRYRLLTTNYVVVETHAGMLRVLGRQAAWEFLEHGLDQVSFCRARASDERQAKEIISRHRDKSYSFCDAISFAVMERLNLHLALAFDDHFRQYGFSTPLWRTRLSVMASRPSVGRASWSRMCSSRWPTEWPRQLLRSCGPPDGPAHAALPTPVRWGVTVNPGELRGGLRALA